MKACELRRAKSRTRNPFHIPLWSAALRVAFHQVAARRWVVDGWVWRFIRQQSSLNSLRRDFTSVESYHRSFSSFHLHNLSNTSWARLKYFLPEHSSANISPNKVPQRKLLNAFFFYDHRCLILEEPRYLWFTVPESVKSLTSLLHFSAFFFFTATRRRALVSSRVRCIFKKHFLVFFQERLPRAQSVDGRRRRGWERKERGRGGRRRRPGNIPAHLSDSHLPQRVNVPTALPASW